MKTTSVVQFKTYWNMLEFYIPKNIFFLLAAYLYNALIVKLYPII